MKRAVRSRGPGGSRAVVFVGLLAAAVLAAASPAAEAGGPVFRIAVEGNRAADRDLVLRTLSIPLGRPLSVVRLREGTRGLYNLGLFSSITIVTQDVPDSGTVLIVRLEENPRIASLDFAGNKKIGTEDLKGKISLRTGQILSRRKLWESRLAVEKAYADAGFASARCIPTVDTAIPEQTTLTLRVEEGAKVKIEKISIEGNKAFSEGVLRSKLKLKANSIIRRRRYTAERGEEERTRLEEFYRNHGYRDATVELAGTDFLDDGRRVALRYRVEEGHYYVFGTRTWAGNVAVTTEALEKAAQFQKGDPFSQEKLEQTTAQAYSLYTDKGYLLEINVSPQSRASGDTVSVDYGITEGRPSHVREVQIRGNRTTKERVIRREMLLYPGELLRRSALLRAQRDIFALGFFEDVQMDYEPTGEGTDVNLIFHVKERSTGSASGGVGYSSETGLTGMLELKHPNIFGNGQSISLFLERGGKRENYEISFQDPWVFGRPTSVGFDIFNTRRTLDLYTETRRGGGVNVGRIWPFKFPDYTRIAVGYSIEDYKYSDFDASLEASTSSADGIPVAERLRASSGLISSSYVVVSRNSTDNPFYPTLGSRTALRLELAGGLLAGEQHYVKPTIDHRVYLQPFWKPVLMLRWRAGWLGALPGGKPVPSTETFRLGGTRPFEYVRGYDDYYIVPDENIRGTGSNQIRFPGGRSMFAFTAELQFPIVTPLRGLLFFDGGNTWNRLGDMGLTGLKEGIGAGLRFEIPMLGQIGLDYAYGTAVRNWRFHFIFGPSI
jgi:outer membrane protein insertion porin family